MLRPLIFLALLSPLLFPIGAAAQKHKPKPSTFPYKLASPGTSATFINEISYKGPGGFKIIFESEGGDELVSSDVVLAGTNSLSGNVFILNVPVPSDAKVGMYKEKSISWSSPHVPDSTTDEVLEKQVKSMKIKVYNIKHS